MSVSKYSSDMNLEGGSLFEGGKPHQHKRRFSIINAGFQVPKNDQVKKLVTENNPNPLNATPNQVVPFAEVKNDLTFST